MCGIAGFLSSKKKAADAARISEIMAVQNHRGPDAGGNFSDDRACLIHNRLSLLDLMESGNQPFEDEQNVLVYNGEIYNFEEIRNLLPRKEYASSSDTAVLFEALKVWGIVRTVKNIEGMFAFAWYDKGTHELILARDRLGIKPLFYGSDDKSYYFASELKGVLAMVDGKPNYPKILFSGLGVLEKSRHETAWQNIFQVKPGTFVEIGPNGVSETRYYDMSQEFSESEYRRVDRLTHAAVVDEFGTLFKSSVKKMLICDAPMGAYVSGGVDSSLIAAVACSQNANLKLFTANVKGQYSEFEDAKLLAASLNKPLSDYPFEKEMALRDWARVTWHYESPIVVHFNAIPFSNVSELARQQKVKAVLTGEGSDELFLGYPKLLTRKYDRIVRSPTKLLERVYKTIPGLHSYVFNHGGSQDLLNLFEQATQNFTRQVLREEAIARLDFLPASRRREHYLSAQMMQEGIMSLLWRNDRMGMMNSIEARFPFLDEKIVTFALNLPIRFKIARTGKFYNYKHPFLIDKYPVRKVAERFLPKTLAYKKKNGFPTYGLRHISMKPTFLKNGHLAEMLQLTNRQVEYMVDNFNGYNLALLGSVEIWSRLFLGKEIVETVTDSINANFNIR